MFPNIPLKYLQRIVAIALLLFITGCFEVIEEITINQDGKGKAGLTVNLSQGKSKLASIMLMDSIKGKPVPSEQEIIEKLNEGKVIAEETPGLHNVVLTSNFDDFIFELSCEFDSVECINQFIYRIENHYSSRHIPEKNLFSFQNNTYFRNADYLIPNKHKKEIAAEKKGLLSAKYVSIVRLPQEVESMTNEKANLAKNKKAIMLKVSGDKLLENTHSVTNKVKLKTQ